MVQVLNIKRFGTRLVHPLDSVAAENLTFWEAFEARLKHKPASIRSRELLHLLLELTGFDAVMLISLPVTDPPPTEVELCSSAHGPHAPGQAIETSLAVANHQIDDLMSTDFRRGMATFGARYEFSDGHHDSSLYAFPVTGAQINGRDPTDLVLLFTEWDPNETGAAKNKEVRLDPTEARMRVFAQVAALDYLKPIHRSGEFQETAIDALRIAYGSVPLSLFERRFELFAERVEQVRFAYQPIVRVDAPLINGRPLHVEIVGWEALARYKNEESSPTWLFQTADLWGQRFQTELDLHALREATDGYAAEMGLQLLPMRMLTINLAPGTLATSGYRREFDTFRTTNPDLPLVLELSEKYTLAPDHRFRSRWSSVEPSGANALLASVVEEYVGDGSDLRTTIAVDDFGVDYSSIARTSTLRPRFIKLDKTLIRSPDREPIFRFAADLALRHDSVVIAEGVEDNEHLADVLCEGINHIQGWAFARSHDRPVPFGNRRMSEIKRMVNETLDMIAERGITTGPLVRT